MTDDKKILDELTKKFFGAFSSKRLPVHLGIIYELFISEGIIIKNVGDQAEIYDLEQFVKPREELLNSGTLLDFHESEIHETTQIFGNIAQRWSTYEKSGVLNGEAFQTKGMKTIQFVKAQGQWKISAVAWDDERDGLKTD